MHTFPRLQSWALSVALECEGKAVSEAPGWPGDLAPLTTEAVVPQALAVAFNLGPAGSALTWPQVSDIRCLTLPTWSHFPHGETEARGHPGIGAPCDPSPRSGLRSTVNSVLAPWRGSGHLGFGKGAHLERGFPAVCEVRGTWGPMGPCHVGGRAGGGEPSLALGKMPRDLSSASAGVLCP